jgi:predicted transcriptional regulator
MTARPPLSKGEMEVARVVWELGEATVGQVHQAFPADRGMQYATVQTYLRRLEAKGYVRTRRDGRNKIYRAKVDPSQVIQETVDDLTTRLFGGETLPLMLHLIEAGDIKPEETTALRKALDTLEAEQSTND